MNIVTVFSGRKHNIDVLRKYLKKAIDLKIIDEVHFWNNARISTDEEYLKTISNLKRTSSTGCGNYILITPEIVDNSFDLRVKATSDIHIKITNQTTEYEIVIGGWNNTRSVIRENNNELCCLNQHNVADGTKYNNFECMIVNDMLYISKNNELLLCHKIQDNFEIQNIYFKTGFNSVGHLTYNTTQHKGFYFMDTCEKSWRNYYNYYTDPQFHNDIVMKCDDDIVFMDLYKLPQFIEFVKNNEYDLVFANTVNNGVSAYYQQNKYNLIPKELMDLEYPEGGFCGSLWASGVKAEMLHNYFIDNYSKFIDHEYNDDIIHIPTRYSINFFGYKCKNWYKIADCWTDDESKLTIEYVAHRQFKNVFYSDFVVAHLSFFKQIETGINITDLISKYNKLYYTLEDSGRFCENALSEAGESR
jgi:hypothetical protein